MLLCIIEHNEDSGGFLPHISIVLGTLPDVLHNYDVGGGVLPPIPEILDQLPNVICLAGDIRSTRGGLQLLTLLMKIL